MKYCISICVYICSVCFFCYEARKLTLGENEAIRVYTEFYDGYNRGMINKETGKGGLVDEDFDATSAIVINWHKYIERDSTLTSQLEYRKVFPKSSTWEVVKGKSLDFWYRDEKINRMVLKGLTPNSVYAFRVKNNGKIYHFRTLPTDLKYNSIKLAVTSDHQSPQWNKYAHNNAKMVSLIKPDMFVMVGDYVSDEGIISEENASRWAKYLDELYGFNGGYFLYSDSIGGELFTNIIIPHVAIVGNHDNGDEHHIRWPADLYAPKIIYPKFTPANWMELLFHFPFKSEGFYSEYSPEHPNINEANSEEDFGYGGFGKLSFGNYLLLIALDNGSQNWEGEPDGNLLDWEGNSIIDKWPWYKKHHSDVRQDIWLKKLLEPDNGLSAGQNYDYIIPFWHRGLFGPARINMSYKNRGILQYWLPILYRNGVRFFIEAHDHLYGRTIPMKISDQHPTGTYLKKIYYSP